MRLPDQCLDPFLYVRAALSKCVSQKCGRVVKARSPFPFFFGPIVLIQGASALLIGPEGMTGLIYILAGAAKNLTRQNPTAPAIRRSG